MKGVKNCYLSGSSAAQAPAPLADPRPSLHHKVHSHMTFAEVRRGMPLGLWGGPKVQTFAEVICGLFFKGTSPSATATTLRTTRPSLPSTAASSSPPGPSWPRAPPPTRPPPASSGTPRACSLRSRYGITTGHIANLFLMLSRKKKFEIGPLFQF